MITVPTIHLPNMVAKLAARGLAAFNVHRNWGDTYDWAIFAPGQEPLLLEAKAELDEDIYILELAKLLTPYDA